jgi:hypothetical protein
MYATIPMLHLNCEHVAMQPSCALTQNVRNYHYAAD